MSNPDSFIDEVTEEVRRDRLFAAFRRYGWIAILAVVLIVGGAAYNEWQKARAAARAEAFGNALLSALGAPDPAARRAAVAAVPADGAQIAVRELMLASDPAADRAGSLAALSAVEGDASLPQTYRDLATLRRVLLLGTEAPLADRRAALEPLAVAGRPFRTLAMEILAYLAVEAGEKAEAAEALARLAEDQEAPESQRRRARQVIEALGGSPADG